jgi:hypothetical protein
VELGRGTAVESDDFESDIEEMERKNEEDVLSASRGRGA